MTRPETPGWEPRYTLTEAAKILARQECDNDGHDLTTVISRDLGQTTSIHDIYCRRCGARFQEVNTP